MTIPADSITFTDDGHAWLIIPEQDSPSAWKTALDRPCDTCDGHPPEWDHFGRCPDCIDGRHTFDIEVGNHRRPPSLAMELAGEALCDGCVTTFRVSVVPGMVIPITEGLNCSERVAHVCHNEPWSHTGWLYHSALSSNPDIETEFPVVMPPAAAPGMWAVKLTLAPDSGRD